MDFYKHPQMSDGFLNKCKDCTKKDNIENRNNNIDYYIEYDKNRSNLPHRIEARKEYSKRKEVIERNRNYKKSYFKTDIGKEVHKRAIKKYLSLYPIKRAAHMLAYNAIQNKTLKKQKCQVCGIKKVEAHHDDYTKPLNVRWLCNNHHREWHKNNEPIY